MKSNDSSDTKYLNIGGSILELDPSLASKMELSQAVLPPVVFENLVESLQQARAENDPICNDGMILIAESLINKIKELEQQIIALKLNRGN